MKARAFLESPTQSSLSILTIKEVDIMDYVKAFLIGGLICALVQILMEKTKMMPGRIMVTLVVTGCILGAIGIYEPFLKWLINKIGRAHV